MLRKVMLATVVAAIMAVTAPVAQADQWEIGGVVYSGIKAAQPVLLEGNLTENHWGANPSVSVGPCHVTALGKIWNEEKQARGEITSYKLTSPCPVKYQGTQFCTVTTQAVSEGLLPYPIAVSGKSVNIGIYPEGKVATGTVFVERVFSSGCSLGSGNYSVGSLNGGAWDNATSSIVYSEDGGLYVGAGRIPAYVSGQLSMIGPEEEVVQLVN